MTQPRQMSDSFRVGALLACTGGFLDAFTYLVHGGVFANAQTGNVVLLGLHLAHGNLGQALHYFLPILAFAGGVFLAQEIRRVGDGWHHFHWRQGVLLLEVGLLALCLCADRGQADAWVNITVSFICSLQVQAFRKVHGHPLTTTMCTGNLRSTVEALIAWHRDGDLTARQRASHTLGIVLCFLLGAAIGVACIDALPQHAALALLLPISFLLIALALQCRLAQ